MFARIFSLLLVSALALPALFGQSKRPMTFEDLMAVKRLGEATATADGKWLAYSVATVDLEQNAKSTELWLQRLAGGEPFKVAVAKPGDSGLQFSKDGKSVLFLSARDGAQQVWLASFDPATGAVANPRKLTALATEADNAKWSPDGNSVLFTSSVYPDCPAIAYNDGGAGDRCNAARDRAAAESKVKAQIFTHLLYRHWNRYTGEKRSHLFEISVADGAVRDLTPGNPHEVPPFSLEGGGGFDISPDGRELAYTDNPDAEPAVSTSAQIYTLDLTSPAAKPVKVSTAAGGNFNPAYSPDGKYLAWRSQERAGYESDRFRLTVYDRAAKTVKTLLPKFDRWIGEFAWGVQPGSLFFTAEDHGETSVYGANVSGGLVAVVAYGGDFSGLMPIPAPGAPSDPQILLAQKMNVNAPAELVSTTLSTALVREMNIVNTGGVRFKGEELGVFGYSKSGASGAQITHLNDGLLAQLDLPKMQSFWFTAKDGVRVQGFVIPPPGYDPHKKYPVKLLIHGGPQGAWGDAWSYRWNAELFAANGYVVVMINPRGSTGYGQAFVDGVNGDWGGKPFTDLMEGLDYAERRFAFIDKSRECALGASYGGFMANWILGHSDRFRCIVSHDGMFNPEAAYGETEELWFNEWEFKGRPWDYYGKTDAENPFRKWSPALSAKNFKTPTLVIHGQLDYRLDVAQGFELFTTLQRLQVPSEMLYFPDEGHWVLKPQNSRLWYKTVNAWVDRWTK
jgi:dipeptidyl aminopeptidase/acylaminoacyl peptidase